MLESNQDVQQSEEALLEAAKGGDRDALVALLERYAPGIRAGLSINRKWQGVLDADDVMQVTYFDAFHSIIRFESGIGAFGGWLRRLAQHNLRDAVRALECAKRPNPRDRLMPLPEQDSVVWLYELASGAGTTPSAHFGRQEMRAVLESEINRLPEDYRTVLTAVYFEERTVADIAEAMGRSRGAVHLLRIRALDRLRGQVAIPSSVMYERT